MAKSLAIPAGLEPATYCLEGSCSIQLSYGTVRGAKAQYSAFGRTTRAPLKRRSMRPLTDAVELEIVGIRDRAALRLLGLLDPVGDALAGRVGDRLLLRVEPQLHLLARVAGRRPAHQRLDLARLDPVEFEQPLLRPGLAGLHRGLGGLVDAGGGHRSVSLQRAAMVGAAGFEPATLCSQSRCATRLLSPPPYPSRWNSLALAVEDGNPPLCRR